MRNPVKTFWKTPRKSSWRPVVFYVHLIVGLTLGALASVVCLSGTMVVFKPEIERSLIRHIAYVQTGETTQSVESEYATVAAHYPGYKILNADLYPEPDLAHSFNLRGPHGRVQVYVDKYSGALVGEDRFEHKPTEWIYELHVNLLSGKRGLIVNGIGALLLVILCASGIVIWWPGILLWRNAFHYERRARWKRKNYDIHKLVGIFSGVLLIVVAITGAYFSFEKTFETVIAKISNAPSVLGPPKTEVVRGLRKPSLDTLLQKANAVMPDGEVTMLNFPGGAGTTYSVRKRLSGDFRRMGDNLVYLNQYTGDVVRVTYHRDLSGTIRFTRDLAPLHYGTFAGAVSRVAWLVVGVGPIILYITGCLMWWNRVLSKWWRTRFSATKPISEQAYPVQTTTG